jgi:hypothetical protein
MVFFIMKPRGIIETKSVAYTGERARKGCFFKYSVSGRGRFPDDMLRYDGVTVDVAFASLVEEGIRELRTIMVTGRGCTPARWSSFGWSVHPEISEMSDKHLLCG